jgi:hypothetical protein
MSQMSNDDEPTVNLTLMGGRVRVDYGDQAGGRYVIVNYDEIKDYVLSLRDRAELVELYGLAD